MSIGPDRGFGAGNLTMAALSAELLNRFNAEVRSMATPDVARAAVGVDREYSVSCRAPPLDERTRLPELAESEGFEPLEDDDREAVVQLCTVDVGRFQVCASPKLLSAMERRAAIDVVEVI